MGVRRTLPRDYCMMFAVLYLYLSLFVGLLSEPAFIWITVAPVNCRPDLWTLEANIVYLTI